MWSLVGIPILLLGLILIPFGLPGTWVMIALLAVATFAGQVGVYVLLACLAIAFAGEVVEFFIVKRYNVRYGGSNRAFWGAIVGGILGIFVGVPIPIIGSIIAGIVGSFLGALLVTVSERRTVYDAARVGWGVTLGRVWSAAAKVAAGTVIVVLGSWALLF